MRESETTTSTTEGEEEGRGGVDERSCACNTGLTTISMHIGKKLPVEASHVAA